MKKWIIALTIFIVTMSIYIYLGGWNEVVVTELDSKSFKLQGRLYEGNAKDTHMGKCFSDIDALIEAQHSTEKLTAYYYTAPSKENHHHVKVFVGATYSGGQKLSDYLVIEEFTMKECLRAQHKSYPLLTAAYRDIFTYAKENQLVLDSAIAVEQYPTSDSLVLWIPIAKRKN